MAHVERKTIPFTDVFVEAKAAAVDGEPPEMRIKGYGAAFGNRDSYDDVIEPGAFAKTLADARKSGVWPSMLSQHGGMGITAQDMTPIGVWDTLEEDTKGLKSEGIFAPTPRGIEVYTLAKMKPRPAISGLSIGYIPKKFTMGTKAGEPRRILHEVDLLEISPVTFPANGKARITGVKSADGGYTEREFEQLMQDAGFSRSEARHIMSRGFKSLTAMQDAGSTELKELAAAAARLQTLFST